MAKERTPEQDALREAHNKPERKGFISRHMAWFNDKSWGVWTNYNEMAWSFGNPDRGEKDYKPSAWTINFRVWPFALLVFKHNERKVWLGDREWKKGLPQGIGPSHD